MLFSFHVSAAKLRARVTVCWGS